ncbi:MAG: hypothetical protein GY851_00470 [bacterium]|nr:hypothetical protein [bacterium]
MTTLADQHQHARDANSGGGLPIPCAISYPDVERTQRNTISHLRTALTSATEDCREQQHKCLFWRRMFLAAVGLNAFTWYLVALRAWG